jgi:hypothetical protein
VVSLIYHVLFLLGLVAYFLYYEKGRERKPEKDLFMVWYDWWHCFLGFLSGAGLAVALILKSWVFALTALGIYIIFLTYQVIEPESFEQTVRDLIVYGIGGGLGFMACLFGLLIRL